MKAVALESERLKLVPLSTYHLSQSYVDWLNDSEVNRYMEVRGNYTTELLELFLKEQEQKDILFWAIHIKENGKHIGNIKIDPIADQVGEYGIMIGDKDSWGKGFAKEASVKVIEYCFDELKLKSIELGVIGDNLTAVAMYRKMGFTIERILSNVGIYNGKICDSLRMSLKNERL